MATGRINQIADILRVSKCPKTRGNASPTVFNFTGVSPGKQPTTFPSDCKDNLRERVSRSESRVQRETTRLARVQDPQTESPLQVSALATQVRVEPGIAARSADQGSSAISKKSRAAKPAESPRVEEMQHSETESRGSRALTQVFSIQIFLHLRLPAYL